MDCSIQYYRHIYASCFRSRKVVMIWDKKRRNLTELMHMQYLDKFQQKFSSHLVSNNP